MKTLLTFLLSLIAFASLLSADDTAVMDYNNETTCLIRELKVHKAPKWVAKIELAEGKKIYFSSPKSMFEFYHNPGKWPELAVKNEKSIKEILVMDYDTFKPVKAKAAFFVYGSNVTSPAGDDLVAFDSYKTAQEFAKAHNGKRVLGFREVSEALIRLLNGRI
ncbi:MAG: nitrous oxide reductase accessory protein NosL [Sulfurimonas sp.]|nr:nitrous oxide reductase accessory protein NosL [Sulfurimonas sp.]MDD3060394.1 nitrous oxide reductase accessory protein NosL [Sulfurimonas sp.]MDD5202392.1 nitrous oxide reductase accessory protein NosL [Sulfurimonas sp.]